MAQLGAFPTRTAAVTDEIREDIVSLRLKPGTVIRDNELAERYGVSSSPVREALAQMSAERLVEILPNKTKFVTRIDRKTVGDFLEVHRILVQAGFALGAPRVTREQVDEMGVALEHMQAAASDGNSAAFVRAGREFLDPVYRAGGNAELRRQVSLHGTWLRRMMAMLPPDYFAEAVKAYGKLFDCFRTGDIDRACASHDLILQRLESLVLALDLPDENS